MKKFFAFTNSGATATLHIFDVIGLWGLQAADFRAELDKAPGKALNVEINSPGGDVFVGLAIYNMLKASGKTIKVKVMGVAASAASLIAMAGDSISMPKNTFMMVHSAASGTAGRGTAEDHRTAADLLDKIGQSLTAIYSSRTGMAESEVKEMLSVDTWLDADDALKKGFATEVTEEIKATASFDVGQSALPANVKAVFGATKRATSAPNQHAEIRTLCALANRAQDAAGFIATGKTLDQVRAALLPAMTSTTTSVTTGDIWSKRK